MCLAVCSQCCVVCSLRLARGGGLSSHQGVNLRLAGSESDQSVFGVCMGDSLTAFDKLVLFFAAPLMLIGAWGCLWVIESCGSALHAALCPNFHPCQCRTRWWKWLLSYQRRLMARKRRESVAEAKSSGDDDAAVLLDSGIDEVGASSRTIRCVLSDAE